MYVVEAFLRKMILLDVADGKFMDAINAFQNWPKA